jgi:hypothetical protein
MLRWTIVVLALAIPAMFWPVFAQAIAPDPTLTPGAVRTTDVAELKELADRGLGGLSSSTRPGPRVKGRYDKIGRKRSSLPHLFVSNANDERRV